MSTPPVVPPARKTIPNPNPASNPPNTAASNLSPPISISILYFSKIPIQKVNIIIP